MIKFFNSLSIAFVLLLLFVGCKPKSLEIDIPEATPKIVVNSYAADGLIVLFLTKSFTPLADTADANFIKELGISGADAKIIYGSSVFDFIEIPPDSLGIKGVYLAEVATFGANQEIKLEVSADGFDRVTATTNLLARVEEFDAEAIRFPFDTAYATVFYTFGDVNPNQHNYYALGISGGEEEDLFKGIDTLRKLNMSKFVLFDELEFPYSTIDGAVNILAEKNDTLTIGLSHISKEYYEYLQVFQKGGSFFSSITKEPINYPTNVIGGYGFFNAYLPNIHVLAIEE